MKQGMGYTHGRRSPRRRCSRLGGRRRSRGRGRSRSTSAGRGSRGRRGLGRTGSRGGLARRRAVASHDGRAHVLLLAGERLGVEVARGGRRLEAVAVVLPDVHVVRAGALQAVLVVCLEYFVVADGGVAVAHFYYCLAWILGVSVLVGRVLGIFWFWGQWFE